LKILCDFNDSISSQYDVLSFFNLKRSIFKILNKIPYNEITKTNIKPRNIFELIIANLSRMLESLIAKICVIINVTITNNTKYSKENICNDELIMKIQNERPKVTVNAFNLDDDERILNRIN